ncbi:MAG: hypothetical protein K8U57_28770 [Planctomycetes bacterium]|nr:hypothetical protein [Planctomycetota bacterium]
MTDDEFVSSYFPLIGVAAELLLAGIDHTGVLALCDRLIEAPEDVVGASREEVEEAVRVFLHWRNVRERQQQDGVLQSPASQ